MVSRAKWSKSVCDYWEAESELAGAFNEVDVVGAYLAEVTEVALLRRNTIAKAFGRKAPATIFTASRPFRC